MIQNYKQTDPRWADMIIGGRSMTMAEGGCGVCAIADVVDTIPPVVASWMDTQGFIDPVYGTEHAGVIPTLQHYGSDGDMLTPGYINGQNSSPYFTQVYDIVSCGYCAIFLMGGTQTKAGGACRTDYWSRAGHYICICGAKDGELLAHDPAWAARDGYHSIMDVTGSKVDSYNGNVKKIWTTVTRWKGDDTVFDFEFKQVSAGDQGVDVLAVQEILKARGIKASARFGGDGEELTLDRSFGRNTRAAVMTYQSMEKITVDGIAGKTTFEHLFGKGAK